MSTELWILILLAATIPLILILITLTFLYVSLKLQTDQRVQNAISRREKELEIARDQILNQANQNAITQLQQWREQELESLRKQLSELADKEAQIKLDQWIVEQKGTLRQDAIQKSRAVTIGMITEHLIPYLPDFVYNPKDARFLGSPIDFIVFEGLDAGELKDVIFIEVKTGLSSLTARERKIREAIESKKVRWVELRPSLDTISIKPTSEDEEIINAEKFETRSSASVQDDKPTPHDRLGKILGN